MTARFLLGLLLLIPLFACAACKVNDPELQGSYEGGCKKGLAHGQGKATGEATYEGGFYKGMKQGQGVKMWPWGDRYEGGFLADRRHGAGTYTWGAGSPWAGERYEGDYVADKREGQGTYWWPTGDRFEGQWKADLRYGYSAMELRRQAAEKARTEALTPGTQVCSQGKVGLAHGVLRVGTVEEAAQNTVKVRLLRTEAAAELVAGRGMEAGTVIEGAASDWTPCL